MPDADDAPLGRIPFTPRAEAGVRALANWMQLAAVFGFVAAAAKVLAGYWPRPDPGKLIDAVLTVLLAVWVYKAGVAFRRVATTDEADQRHLMEGFRWLRRVFLLQSILVIVALAFVVLAVVLVAVVMVARGR